MKESYSEDIMLCFVQGFGDGEYSKNNRVTECNANEFNPRTSRKKQHPKRVSVPVISEKSDDFKSKKSDGLVTGKSLKLSSGDQLANLPEVKRSFSDRFSIVTDASGGGKRPARALLTIRKTWSTGNFAAGAAGGGCGAPRSAPATPLQLEPHPRTKHDKQTLKPLSGSAPSVRVAALASGDTTEGKQPYKSRQKKFQRHFPQVGPEERVLNYYSCALLGDLLLQGHLYITMNYFAFYSNVFGYVTKLLIPTTSVLRITKEKVARIIPNAVGVCTRDERHVFGSLLSRDSTYKLMVHVWKSARAPEAVAPNTQELRASEVELEPSEYSGGDDSSSGGRAPATPRPDCDALTAASAAVIQPALLTGSVPAPRKRTVSCWRPMLIAVALLLTLSAFTLTYKLYHSRTHAEEDLTKLSGDELYEELVRWRSKLHGRAANELHAFLTTNLLLLTKVRQSLEALSGVILADMPQANEVRVDIPDLPPNDTVFS